MRRLLVMVLSAALGAVSPVGAQTAFGPLATEEAGAVQVELWMGYANIFEQDSAATHQLFMDLERLSTDMGARWGVTQRLEVGGRLSFETTGGGVLDAFVSDWHRKLGLGNGNREKYPHGVYAQRLTDGAGKVRLDVPPRTMALGARRSSRTSRWSATSPRG